MPEFKLWVTTDMPNDNTDSFLGWMNLNGEFINAPLASQKWDREVTSNPELCKAISKCKKTKQIFQKVEDQITQDYADLIDITLRRAFQKIKNEDLANPIGFSDLTRGSPELNYFFECRKIFENFMVTDIMEHGERTAQIMAFTRWVNIANLLLKSHNYEAFGLVVPRLLQINSRLKLMAELSEKTKKMLTGFDELVFPVNNYETMRAYIKTHKHDNNFTPTFIMSKDMTFLNEVLGDSKNLKSKDISKTHPAYKKILRKERMLSKLLSSQKDQPELPEYLAETFVLINQQYQDNNKEDNLPRRPVARAKTLGADLPKHRKSTAEDSQAIKRRHSAAERMERSHAHIKTVPEEQISISHSGKSSHGFWHEAISEITHSPSSLSDIQSILKCVSP